MVCISERDVRFVDLFLSKMDRRHGKITHSLHKHRVPNLEFLSVFLMSSPSRSIKVDQLLPVCLNGFASVSDPPCCGKKNSETEAEPTF